MSDKLREEIPCAWRAYGSGHWNDGVPNQQSIDYYGKDIEYAYRTPPAPVVPRPIQRWPFVESPGEFAQRLRDAMVFFGDALPAIRNVVIENPPTLSAEYLAMLAAAPEMKP